MRVQWWLLWLAVPALVVAQEETRESTGPPVLSRGAGPGLLRSGTESVKMRVYATVDGIYESGLTSFSVNENGDIPNDSSHGMQAGVGAYGFHRWKRTVMSLDYRGSYYHFARNSYYDGTDHTLSLGISHQMSRRTHFTLRQAAGTASRDTGSYSPYGFADPTYAQLPTQELFNNRTHYLNSMADLTFQKSSRLSFNFGGSAAVIERRSKALVGSTAEYARGDVMYRVTRNQTIGVDYGFTHYAYGRNHGTAFMHMGALNYSARLGRYWTFSLRGGVISVDSQGLIRVDIDPVIAAIIGRSYGVEIYGRQNLLSTGGVNLQRNFRKSSLSFSYSDGATPGNGFYLASRNRSAAANFSYTGVRRWNFGANFDYSKYSTLSRSLDDYKGFGGGVGAAYQLGHGLHLTTRINTRDYEIRGTSFARNTVSASIGLAYSSGDTPLALW
jgi:hypothetical protein